ncbi:hypothetical protein [Colwellia sp. Bg11-28]|uniref:hypothetical protein n=1 Tax=Colwellia sp. Bg11-28 TaxID=2058305 RepID=UPI000C32853E|nr:hypothetical protein [Colwellia sp. Bg11-28]PKH89154.1 hypothetical protein CXF79_02605 [Colwellia sp. Bg11-28]
MLIQFKKMRNALIRDGKFGKYCLYAIGEIFLVVTGILIALQVNNYDLAQQKKAIEHHYLLTIKLQLSADKEKLSAEIYGMNERIDDYLVGMKLINENDQENLEVLASKVIRLLEYGDFRRQSSVFQTLVYSGEIKYVNSKEIIENLQEIERTYEITERLENTQANLVMIHAAPAVNKSMDFESGKIIAPDIVFTTMFKNNFSIAIRLVQEKKSEFEHALSVIDNTIKMIDSQINKNEHN